MPLEIQVQKGKSITIPGSGYLKKQGYTFAGWNTNDDGSGYFFYPFEDYEITEDITLFAIWTEDDSFYDDYYNSWDNEYYEEEPELSSLVVSFDSNGSNGDVPLAIEVTSGDSITVPEPTSLEKDGYVFYQWNTKADGEGTPYFPMESVTIPSYLTDDIVLYAIWVSDSLLYGYLKETDSYEVRGYNDNLTSLVIPSTHNGKNVTSIGDKAFSNCTRLEYIFIPNTISSIGNYAFQECSKLSSINIPDGVLSIGDYAFDKCSRLSSINIPSGVLSIGDGTFSECAALKDLVLPSCVMSIGDYAFSGSGLSSINIPDSVTSIGEYAFWGCGSLSRIELPSTLTNIADGMFCYCTSIESIIIPNSVMSIGNSSFSGCERLKSIQLSSNVISIGNNAFKDCSRLFEVKISNSLINIGESAFSNCHSLEIILIPDSVTEIGKGAFSNCGSLWKVILPNSITSLGVFRVFVGQEGKMRDVHGGG